MEKNPPFADKEAAVADEEAAVADGWSPPSRPPQESWVPWLMPTFALADVIIFVYTMYVNDCPANSPTDGPCIFPSLGRFAFEPLSVNPLLGPSRFTLEMLGALDYKAVIANEEWWRLISCIWLHAGVLHLVLNTISLLFIGIQLEHEFGSVKIGSLYLFSGLGASFLSCLSAGNISVGASGAIFGLLGAMLSELITNWTIYANKCAALMTLIVVIVINLAFGAMPQVDSSAHIGGFIAGFLLGFVLLIRPQFGWINQKHIPPGIVLDHVKPKHTAYQYVLWFTALFLLIAGYAICLVKLSGMDPLLD